MDTQLLQQLTTFLAPFLPYLLKAEKRPDALTVRGGENRADPLRSYKSVGYVFNLSHI